MRDLPQELVDHTLDNFAHDLETLKVCSLVCTRWTPRARSHLFSDIRLDTMRQVEWLANLLDANPTLAGLIRKLEMWFDADFQAIRRRAKALLPILARCCLIKQLTLCCGPGEREFYMPAWFIKMVVGVMNRTSFRKLHLVNWDFPTLDIIPRVAALQELEISTSRFGFPSPSNSRYPGQQTVTFSGVMHLHTLAISHCAFDVSDFQKWVNKATRTFHLKISSAQRAVLVLRPDLLWHVAFIQIAVPAARSLEYDPLLKWALQDFSANYIWIDLAELGGLAPRYQAPNLESVQVWMGGMQLRQGQLLRLHLPQVFWAKFEAGLKMNPALKLVALDIVPNDVYEDPDSTALPNLLHLLLESSSS
ncbi:hypothetical protein R3P38DRAFT_3190886 [Favolaschia claudopus]|uniref:F-box domain-containing protein n=1 Tax=Favolaschia claudopus TaxID=2862362 RepID=A0AAW0BLJ7_9AGAR